MKSEKTLNLLLSKEDIEEIIFCIEGMECEFGHLDYDLYLKLIKLVDHEDRYKRVEK